MTDERHLVLARKWRPQRFEDVVGQEHVTRTLKNALTQGRIHHAYLFVGSRGIGKTTTARILARALNCLSAPGPTPEPCGTCENCVSIAQGSNMDVLEIDGASNRGIDDAREIRENVRLVPAHGRYKVYIIDEVHQLTREAFNALLKTLEEPPAHAVFILATTEPQKVPATIISRCQRFDFRRVALDDVVSLLKKIVAAEGYQATPEALYAIAQAAEGGVRDAESILDELISYSDGVITLSEVHDLLGLVDWSVLHRLAERLCARDVLGLLQLVEEVVASGKDLTEFLTSVLRYFRSLLVLKTASNPALAQIPEDEIAAARENAGRFTATTLIRMIEQFAVLVNGFESQLAQRTALEAALIRMAQVGVDLSIETVLEKLAQLGAGGVAAAPAGESAGGEIPPPRPNRAETVRTEAAVSAERTDLDTGRNYTAPTQGGQEANQPEAHGAGDIPEDVDPAKMPQLSKILEVFGGQLVRVSAPSTRATAAPQVVEPPPEEIPEEEISSD